jgi:hypothetical protein
MTRAKVITLSCGIALAIAAVAFWFGMREGIRIGVMLDSVPRGSIAVAQLRALDAGKTGNLRINLEGNVDMALVWAYELQEHPLYPLFEPVWGYPLRYHAQSLQRLANYRKTTPSPLRTEALAKEPLPPGEEAQAHREYVLEGARENDKIIELMVRRYASQPKNAQP